MNDRYRDQPSYERDRDRFQRGEPYYGDRAAGGDRYRGAQRYTFDGPQHGRRDAGYGTGIGAPPRQQSLQGNHGDSDRYFGFDGPPQPAQHEGGWARIKRAFRGPKGYTRSDERIREDVSERLAHQDEVDPSDIEVTVAQGEVTLSGTVQSRREKFRVEDIADSVSGVREVHNRLRLRPSTVTQAMTQMTDVAPGLSQSTTSYVARGRR